MSDQTDLARGWLRKSCSDLAAARRILSGEGPYDTACFHSQQATEKTFKALLAYRGQPIPRAHDLEELARLCQQLEPIPELRLQELAEATDYAVQIRYDLEIWPSQQEARQALALAEQVCALILRHLPPEVHP
jgi:HEPN domain-containing protein